jgi:hypothetical protein
MDEIEIELLANELVNVAFNYCIQRRIRLTEHATRFLRLAAEALIKDPPKPTPQRFPDFMYGPGDSYWLERGREIFAEALEDERIHNEMQLREKVSFPTLVRVLSDTGHRHLLSMGFKD